MKSQLRFIFIVFYLTAVLIFTVRLRTDRSRIFYRLHTVQRKDSQLKQNLWQRQLRLESLISPTAMSRRLNNQNNVQLLH